MSKTVNSGSAERTVNNVMRHEYRVLDEREKALMQKAKDKGVEFLNLLHDISNTPAGTSLDANLSSRELSIAKTKIEEAVMWAVKHITK